MTITLKLSTEQERLLREGAASADAVAMRRVLLQAVEFTIAKLLRLSAKAEPEADFEAPAESPAERFAAHAASDRRPTLKDLLLAESPRADIPVPSRRRWRRRAPEAFE